MVPRNGGPLLQLHNAWSHPGAQLNTLTVPFPKALAEPSAPPRTAGTTGTQKTVFNAVNAIIGAFTLGLPFGLRKSGWLGLLLVPFMGTTCLYTAHLLGHILDGAPMARSYADIAFHVFGRTGNLVISFIFSLELLLGLTGYLILGGDNMQKMIGLPHTMCYFGMACLVLPPCLMNDFKNLAIVSVLGILTNVIVLCILLGLGLTTLRAPGSLYEGAPTQFFAGWQALSLVGLVMASFAGHTVLPDLYSSMATPSEYSTVVNVTFLVCNAYFIVIATLGYRMYGNGTLPEIELNFGDAWGFGSQLVVVLLVLFKFGGFMHVFAMTVQDTILGVLPQYECIKSPFVVRLSLLAVTLAGAIILPRFEVMMGLLGSLCSLAISVTFPCVAYLTVFWDELGIATKALNMWLIGTSAILGVVAAWASCNI